MIKELCDFPADVVAVACKGKVTKSDYEAVLAPAVEKALKTHVRVRRCYEISSEFAGIEPDATREDFEIGMRHLNRWGRIAVVSDVAWTKCAARLFAFVIPGAVRVFPFSRLSEAQ